MKTLAKFLSVAMVLSLFLAACDKNNDATAEDNTVKLVGIQGEWHSSGTNVATLLSYYFKVDSIYAKFNTDNTYLVESYDVDGVLTQYTGTYVQTANTGSNIYTILINQSTPSSGSSEGIFEVYTDSTAFDMKYEVVQTLPDLGNIPPTVTTGFGGTNGGAFGLWNVQKYFRIEK